MSDTDFRPGDKIRITHEITVDRMGETCDQAAYAREGGLYMWNRSHSTVELIERADDPSKDLIGTVRRITYPLIKVRPNAWVYVHVHDHRIVPLSDADVRGKPVIGAVPGTPAYDSWQVACETYEEGFAAGKAAAAADELSRQAGDEEPRGFKRGDVVRNKRTGAVFVVQLGALFEPEYYEAVPLWTGDGSEEPPAHVKKVEGAQGAMVYRCAHGWAWSASTWQGWAWFPSMRSAGPFTEVRD